MIITLTVADIWRAAAVANRRNFAKQDLASTRAFRKDAFDGHFLGACGEIAAARALGADIDETELAGGDDGTDLCVNGVSVQVKTCGAQGSVDLIFNCAADFKAQAAMLVGLLTVERFRILGVIGRKRFLQIAVVKNFGYGDRLTVGNEQLTPVVDFIQWANRRGKPTLSNGDWLADFDRGLTQ